MAQYYRPFVLRYPFFHPCEYLHAVLCLAGIAAEHVPVKITVPFCREFVSEPGHQTVAVLRADSVRTAARESADIRLFAGLLLDNILHLVEIIPERLITRVNLTVIVRISVNANRVARFVFLLDIVSIFRISVVFILVTILLVLADMTAAFRCSPEERMLACMCFILILVTPIGTNNHLFAVINNMFLIAPISLYLMFQLLGDIRDKKFCYPVAVMVYALISVMLVQSAIFGVVYTFKDGEDGTRRDAVISEKIPTMQGVRTTGAHSEALEGLCEYIASTEVSDKGLIVWGDMPGLFYVLDLKPELTTLWPDLDSYPFDDFSAGLTAVEESGRTPILIISAKEAEAFGNVKGYSYSADETDDFQIMLKRLSLMEFMALEGYKCSYSNQEFYVYESVSIDDLWQQMQEQLQQLQQEEE